MSRVKRLAVNPNFNFGNKDVKTANTSGKKIEAIIKRGQSSGVLDFQGVLKGKSEETLTAFLRKYFIEESDANCETKWWEICELNEIRLSHNDMKYIPKNALCFNGVAETLNTILADELRSLKNLNCKNNKVETLGETLPNNLHMKIVDFSHNVITNLPRNLKDAWPGLMRLELSHNQITSLCNGFPKTLQYLNLSNNCLESFPTEDCLSQMTSLKELDLSSNKLSQFRLLNVGTMDIESINLTKNSLRTLEIDLGHCQLLHQLLLGYNQLETVQGLKNIACAKSLTVLNLCANKLSELHEDITLTKLRHLDVSNNNFVEIPNGLGQMETLLVLRIHGNRLRRMKLRNLAETGGTNQIKAYLRNLERPASSFEGSFKNSGCCDALDYISNHKCRVSIAKSNHGRFTVEQISKMLENAKQSVHSLYMDSCGISRLNCDDLHQIEELRILSCTANQMTSFYLSETATNMQKLDLSYNELGCGKFDLRSCCLVEINLSRNCLHQLPQDFGSGVPKLKVLNLSYNKLVRIEDASFSGFSLQELNFSNNQIKEFPTILSNHSDLRVLHAENNDIQEFPSKILSRLVSLQELTLCGNPQRGISADVVNKGSKAIIDHLRSNVTANIKEYKRNNSCSASNEIITLDKDTEISRESQLHPQNDEVDRLNAKLSELEDLLEDFSVSKATIRQARKDFALIKAKRNRLLAQKS